MTALNILAYYYYGVRAIIITLISVGVSVLTEYLCVAAMKKKFNWSDSSPIMSGMILALLMPASVPYRVVVVAAAMMSSVFKYAFGGNSNIIFSPAAAAYAFSALAWPNYVLRYPTPQPFGSLSLASDVPQILGRSFTYAVDNSLSSSSNLDIFWGKLSGPMGTSCVFVIAICTIALYFFKDIEPPVLFSAIAANLLLFVLFPISATGWQAALYSMTTGSFMFVLTFMACDMRFTPKRSFAQILYGSGFALSSYLLRRFCGFENSAVFALLIVCLFAAELDRLDVRLSEALAWIGNSAASGIRNLWIYSRFKNYKEDTITYPAKQQKKMKNKRSGVISTKSSAKKGDNTDSESNAAKADGDDQFDDASDSETYRTNEPASDAPETDPSGADENDKGQNKKSTADS